MQRRLLFLTPVLVLFASGAVAQTYDDYIGAGHSNGITVTASSEEGSGNGSNSINGQGMDQHLRDAARFLGQATTGVNYETIEEVSLVGIDNWIDSQMELPLVNFTDTTWMIWDHYTNAYIDQWGEGSVVGNNDILPFSYYWRMGYWHNLMTSDDFLRQRVALALSEIMVVSEQSDLETTAPTMASYYDVLYSNAFGNFRDLIEEVSYHPAMGYYLTHINNERADPELNIQPDENYAREIMQLFTIGLYELNPDGSIIVDAEDVPVPTYDNNDIKEFAKIFTGLGPTEYWTMWEDLSGVPIIWGLPQNTVPFIKGWEPMIMYEEWHEPGEKFLLNGQVVPAGQTGDQDIADALDNLFNHDNVGPFIGSQLIKRLVKSNPSPEYIERITDVFNNNGQGVRGDLAAVVKAILLDPEARDCIWIDEETAGKMREPMIRYMHLLQAFDASNESGKMWSTGYIAQEGMGQHPLAAPSVFNFFLPSYAPPGPIFDAELVAPEFELLNSATAINYINLISTMLVGNIYMDVTTEASALEVGSPAFETSLFDPENLVTLNLEDEEALSEDIPQLIDRLDLLLAGGTLSEETKATIEEVTDQFFFDPNLQAKVAIYLVMLSPDYIIQK